MRIPKLGIIAALTLSLAFATTLSANAQQGRRAGMGPGNGIADVIGIRGYIQALRLTQAQRDQIRAIMQDYKAQIIQSREALLQARMALLKEDPKGAVDFGSLQTKLMEMRLQILSQIKSKLTSDQLAILQERQQKRIDALQKRLDRLQNQAGH